MSGLSEDRAEIERLTLLAEVGRAHLAFREAKSAEADNRRAIMHLDGAEWEESMMRFSEATAVAFERLCQAIAAWGEAKNADTRTLSPESL